MVWHFDNSIRGNNPPAKLQLGVVQATEGSRALGATQWPSPGSAAGDLYSKATKAELAATTSPSSAWNSGSASGLRVYDISASGPTMEFSVGTGTIAPDSGTGGSGGSSGGAPSGGATSGGATSGGKFGTGGVGGATGGTSSGGGGAGKSNSGGASATGGAANVSGAANMSGGSGGSSMSASGGSGAPVGTAGTAGTVSGAGGNTLSAGGASSGSDTGNTGAENDAGCTCRVGPRHDQSGAGLLALCTTIGAGVLRRRRRRWRRRPDERR